MGLMFADIPSLNSLESVFRCMDRPIVHKALSKLSDKLGDKFPRVIEMIYLPNLPSSPGKEHLIKSMKYPAVIKVSSSYSGFGKIVVKSESDLDDVDSILHLHKDYYTIEPFIEHHYEYRLQKIGCNYRAWRKNSDTSWKNNQGNVRVEDHPWDPKYANWLEECSKLFGGLDMFAIDILHGKDGQEYVIELNDTGLGLNPDHEKEDSSFIKQICLEKMSSLEGRNK